MYLLDTNTLIYYFKGKGKVAVRLLQVAPREVAVSTITVYELEVGLAKTSAPRVRHAQLEDFLAFVTVLPFQRKEATAAAGIRADLERRGLPIGPLDNLIAGTAKAHQAILVTHKRERVFQDPRADDGRLVCVMARICGSVCGSADAEKFTLRTMRLWFEARDVPMSPCVTHQVGRKAQVPCGSPPLPMEDAGDDVVRIGDCQAAQERQSGSLHRCVR